MKNFKFYIFLITVLGISFSCNNKTKIESLPEGNIVGLVPYKIVPLTNDLISYTSKRTKKISSPVITPDVRSSIIVMYENYDIKAVFTPFEKKFKSSIKLHHVYFELDGLVSKFELIISEEQLNNDVVRYSYISIDNVAFVTFDVNLNDGAIFNIQFSNFKDFGDRFENCVKWTFDNMNIYDKLACMAIGPYCAAGIATLCAIGAAEDQFETPDGP